MTGALGVGLDFADEHRVEVTGIFLRNTEDDASLTTGHNTNFAQSSGLGMRNYRIRYEERELELLQFRGTHTIGDATLDLLGDWLGFARDVSVEWYYSDATANTDIPSEMRFSALDTVDPDSGELISTSMRASISSSEYRFTDLEDSATSYGGQFTLPFRPGSNLDRDQRRLRLLREGPRLPPDAAAVRRDERAARCPASARRARCSRTRPSSTRSTAMR